MEDPYLIRWITKSFSKSVWQLGLCVTAVDVVVGCGTDVIDAVVRSWTLPLQSQVVYAFHAMKWKGPERKLYHEAVAMNVTVKPTT